MSQWLILADDLTGAADAGIAFAARGANTQVIWHDTPLHSLHSIDVLACTTESRGLAQARAVDATRTAARNFIGSRQVFKKVDSLLRGHPAAETAALLELLRTECLSTFAVIAPAYPATGRATIDGHTLIAQQHGWQRTSTDNLVDLFAKSGLRLANLSLAVVRDEVAFKSAIASAVAEGLHGIVCDAISEQDLQLIAEASRSLDSVLFVGSGGLAHALAEHHATGTARDWTRTSAAPVLTIIGSQADRSHAAIGRFASRDDIHVIGVRIEHDFAHSLKTRMAEAVTCLKAGQDVLIYLGREPERTTTNELLVARTLAEAVAPLIRHAGSLIASGGDTASALLRQADVSSLQLIAELEPGICLSETLGGLNIPVVTKSGGFGDADCLIRIAHRLRTGFQISTST